MSHRFPFAFGSRVSHLASYMVVVPLKVGVLSSYLSGRIVRPVPRSDRSPCGCHGVCSFRLIRVSRRLSPGSPVNVPLTGCC